jgi:hypothetical protein
MRELREPIFTQASFDKLSNEQICTRIKGYQEMAEIYYRLTGETESDFAEYAREFESERDRRIQYLMNH